MPLTLTEKFTLHIPHSAFVNQKLLPIAHEAIEQALYDRFTMAGFSSWYTQPAFGYYKGRQYAETLVTLFCTPEQAKTVETIFRETITACKAQLQQESYAYERNGKLVIIG